MQDNFDSKKFDLLYNSVFASNATEEFAHNFQEYIDYLTLPMAQSNEFFAVSTWFAMLPRFQRRMAASIYMPAGIELLATCLRIPENLSRFLESDTISLQQLQYLDFVRLPIGLLGVIKEKLRIFIMSKKDAANCAVWELLNSKLLALNDLKQPTVFKKISKLTLILQLAIVIAEPYAIKQPSNTNLCGPTAIITYIFSNMPEQFIIAAEEFFEQGEVTQPFNMLASEYSKNNEHNIITAITCGMKQFSNRYLGYSLVWVNKNKVLEKYSGMTEPSQMIKWLESLGCLDVYEDIAIKMPFIEYNMPQLVSNILLWRRVHTKHHKTIYNHTDRMSLLENFIKDADDSKIILLICENFWREIKNAHFAAKYALGPNSTVSKKRILNIGHYVYLHSFGITQGNNFKCIFYADGEKIESVIDKTKFLQGIKGVIRMSNPPTLQESVEPPAKRRRIC